ncbi:hypothetical protein MTYP_00742 [Methylophilaceae bacterium]|nr:hypothetical protein MTYP_00742 [Methylophilaceae bacterium]
MIRLLRHIVAGVLIITTVTACIPHDSRCAILPGGGQYCLQDTNQIAPFEVQQKVDIAYKDHRETMIAYIEIDSQNLDFVGLTPFGQKLVHVNYNNQQAKAIALPDKRLDPALMVALLQLALWPVDSIRSGLSSRLIVEESDRQRLILDGSKLVMNIRYADSSVPYRQLQISIPAVGMELDIVSLAETEME